MTELSPAAKAVSYVYDNAPEKDTGNHRYYWLAAALREAVDQVVPLADEPEFFCGNCCERNVTQEREDIRREFLAIANELAAQ